MKPLITALVDTYNHEKYIEQALVSVVEQGLSESELEIVVVDDGSTDRTPEIIQKFAPRVKHIRKPNGGQASAFNAGFAESRGEMIAILDGDDWWIKGKLTKVADALERHPEAAAICHGRLEFNEQRNLVRAYVPPSERLINISSVEAVRDAITLWSFLLPSALTVRRKVLAAIMPIPEEMVFMADTPIQVAAMAMNTLVLAEPLCYYRRHAQNLYAVDAKDDPRLLRRYEMTELVYRRVYKILLQLGVPQDCVSQLVLGVALDAKRARLSQFGGRRLEAFQAEIEAFRFSVPTPGLAYTVFKYIVVGAATLALPTRLFYRARDWYAKRELGRSRQRLIGT